MYNHSRGGLLQVRGGGLGGGLGVGLFLFLMSDNNHCYVLYYFWFLPRNIIRKKTGGMEVAKWVVKTSLCSDTRKKLD